MLVEGALWARSGIAGRVLSLRVNWVKREASGEERVRSGVCQYRDGEGMGAGATGGCCCSSCVGRWSEGMRRRSANDG